ncbi:MAG: tRNA (N(6)-L-threonylcarbamoyladenosine(37)-C(2))-methylthiotransferase MtaB [Bacteroidaceae bacterium]|nr:tRNA (N(6)-L-threonylcarbamoyladenosine(37)-C(2))-methylthiotransferase MtaB [Bacteroidaceae bacterium]
MNSNLPLAGKKAVYFTLGCKLNFSETSTVASRLEALGVSRAGKGEIADLCYVNTCSVTEVADHKCRQAIHRLIKQHPGAFVVVTGCYAQLKPDVVKKIEGVDLVLGTAEKGRAVEMIVKGLSSSPSLLGRGADNLAAEEDNVNTPLPSKDTLGRTPFVPSCSCGERTRYFLKVQDGCDYFCTYCTIPFARGRSRNGTIASLVAQAEEVARKGGKEIVLTGVNIGDFGKTTGETFLNLIEALDQVQGIERYRISSIEPNLLTDEVIQFCAQSRAFMPHFHVPLQSGSDEVLRLMHRRYDTALFEHKMLRIRELMPDAFIGVDVIVGMRGETDTLFQEALHFMDRMPVSQYHVFSYSERPGTKALNIPHRVRPEEKHARSQQVLEVSHAHTRAFYNKYIGTVRPVLLEHGKKGVLGGFTDNYIRVTISSCPFQVGGMHADNEIVPMLLTGWNEAGDALTGELIIGS